MQEKKFKFILTGLAVSTAKFISYADVITLFLYYLQLLLLPSKEKLPNHWRRFWKQWLLKMHMKTLLWQMPNWVKQSKYVTVNCMFTKWLNQVTLMFLCSSIWSLPNDSVRALAYITFFWKVCGYTFNNNVLGYSRR